MMENGEMENEGYHRELQRLPGSGIIQPESKLQKLKRSLSLKSMIRSKSVENFFQRATIEAPPPDSIITVEMPPSVTESPLSERHLTFDRSPSISPNPSLSSRSPSLSPSLSVNSKATPTPQPNPPKTHCFVEYVFRRPTVCQQCKQMISGNSKQGLRCKTCKLGAHLWCSSELSQQICNGKSGAFKRNFSSPLLTNERFVVAKEATPTREQGKGPVDPVYEALRYGTSLAQMSRTSFSSISESPCHQMDGEEKLDSENIAEEESAPESEVISLADSEKSETEEKTCLKAPRCIEVHAIHTYVALYKFLPQENNDLELHPGDRIQVLDDANEDWWKTSLNYTWVQVPEVAYKSQVPVYNSIGVGILVSLLCSELKMQGKSRDKVGFFPANFVQRVRPGERVWRVTQGYDGDREKGRMTVKESQICVGKAEETDGFLKLSSGKKRGLVSSDCVEEI